MTTWRNRWDRGPLELIARDYLAGIPVNTISATHKVSPRAIRRTAQQRDLPRRPRGGSRISKLTAQDVMAIRCDQRGTSVVARQYQLHPRTVGKIRSRTTWRHLASEEA